MNEEDIKHILDKYKAGSASDEEIALLESWYLQFNLPEPEVLNEQERMEAFNRVGTHLNINPKVKVRKIFWPGVAAAAILLIVFLAGLMLFNNPSGADKQMAQRDVAPGGNNAFLTLNDGKKIDLSSAENGELAKQSGIKVTKLANGQLVYEISALASQPATSNAAIAYNTIETPRGGTYMVILPDGSKVWLNAASSLRYPTVFEKNKQRKVQLNGEAYFEVTHNKLSPFLVETNRQTVEVLGTHFNVNTYTDEQAVRTTLLEGSVKVNAGSSHLLIKPGEQSVLTGNKLTAMPVDVEDIVAWKNGLFQFSDENLESVMRKISRWYDVDIEYADEHIKQIPLTGIITHFTNISKVLRMLELTKQVHFKIEGRKIIVSK
ncbi:FecR family protein [Pedobacter rhodius]|uniref:DUF4974 domain-containing protein n=1 Tax=Pedobacter rhodius TaxID=3004098 RepID=A0ABT4KUC0_9SPHI|nr:FecR domain-containing protein [Pedobacter sp. SJ11]MCZ4222525.1 DUF4974 domain-containing protein [Pedobacter sp. SJ11]